MIYWNRIRSDWHNYKIGDQKMKTQYIINTVQSNGKLNSIVVNARDKREARRVIKRGVKIISINQVKRQANIYK